MSKSTYSVVLSQKKRRENLSFYLESIRSVELVTRSVSMRQKILSTVESKGCREKYMDQI